MRRSGVRFKVEPRDVPAPMAARRLGLAAEAFAAMLPDLMARGFPAPDPTTGHFDLTAIDHWADARHPHLRGAPATMGARDAGAVVKDRIDTLRRGASG